MKKVLFLFAACFMLLSGNLSAQNYWQEIYCTFNLNFSINGQNKNVSSEIPKNQFPVPLEFNSSDYGTFLYEPWEDNPMPPEDPSIMPEPKPGFFDMLPDGNYEVTFQRFIPNLDLIGSLPIFIKPDFEPRQDLAYTLSGRYNLKIKVVDIDTGEPITNCPVNFSMHDPNIQLYFDENILTNASGEIEIESIGSSGNTLSISKEPIADKYEFVEASYKATKDNYSPVYRLFLTAFNQVENEVTISLKKIIPPIIVEPNYGDPTIVLTTTSQGRDYSFYIANSMDQPAEKIMVDWGDGKIVDSGLYFYGFLTSPRPLSGDSTIIKIYAPATSSFSVSYVKINSLYFDKADYLTNLTLDRTPILNIDKINLSSLIHLKYLNLGETTITHIDLSSNRLLESLELRSNKIKQIDLSKQTNLKSLRIRGEQLKTLDISQSPYLKTLWCDANKLESLILNSSVTELDDFHCINNRLSFSTLPRVKKSSSNTMFSYDPQLTLNLNIDDELTIDLSDQAVIPGNSGEVTDSTYSTFKWRMYAPGVSGGIHNKDLTTLETLVGMPFYEIVSSGVFKFNAKAFEKLEELRPGAGKTVYAQVTNSAYPLLTLKSEPIAIVAVPKIVPISYTNNNGQTFVGEYTGVKIGEYYWMNNYFNNPVASNDMPITKAQIDTAHNRYVMFDYNRPPLEPNKPIEPTYWSYGITLDDFKKYYGETYPRWELKEMVQKSKMGEGESKTLTAWRIPHFNDLLQLISMCGNGTMHEVRQYLSYGYDQPEAPSIARISKPYFDWFTPSSANFTIESNGFSSSNTNKYGFNLVPAASRYHNDGTVLTTENYGQRVGYTTSKGDFNGLNQAARLVSAEDGALLIADNPEMRYGLSWEWHPIRMCRPLTDQELGYKLYINQDTTGYLVDTSVSEGWAGVNTRKVSGEQILLDNLRSGNLSADSIQIVKKALNEPAPEGFYELPRGYIRGFYVQYILNNPNPDKTVADIVKIATRNNNLWLRVANTRAASAFENVSAMSIEQTDHAVHFYPNPVIDILRVVSSEKILSVKVYNTAGRLIDSLKDVGSEINMSSYSSGFYILKMQTETGNYSQKIIKK